MEVDWVEESLSSENEVRIEVVSEAELVLAARSRNIGEAACNNGMVALRTGCRGGRGGGMSERSG
jgi:hypothetical protein